MHRPFLSCDCWALGPLLLVLTQVTSLVSAPLPEEAIPLSADAWILHTGKVEPKANSLEIDNRGGPFWIGSKKPLTSDFRLRIRGRISYLKGGQKLYATQKNVLRTLFIRVCDRDTSKDILGGTGFVIRHTHTQLSLSKGFNIAKAVGAGNGPTIPSTKFGRSLLVGRETSPPVPFDLEITKEGPRASSATTEKRS